MKRIALTICLVFLSLFFWGTKAFAARSISIISLDKDTVKGEEEITVNASSSGFLTGEECYVKGAFYQDGSSTNYFGYTKNGDSWIKNSESTINQKKVSLDSWDGKITVKSDFSDSGYKGEGSYKFKIGFYYIKSTGDPSSVNWSSNTSDITINENDPTPTSTITPEKTPTPTPTSTLTPTPGITPLATLVSPSQIEQEVLATESSFSLLTFSTPPATPKQKIKAFAASKTNLLLPIFVLVGFVFLLTCGILISRNIIKGRNEIFNKKL